MGELITFPKTPGEPIPPREPQEGEKPPENVIFPREFQRKLEEEETEGKEVTPGGEKLVLEELAEVTKIWERVKSALSGRSLESEANGWTYRPKPKRGDDLIEISQTDPVGEKDGYSIVKYVERSTGKSTTLQITTADWPNKHIRKERVDITQTTVASRAGRAEPVAASIYIGYDDEGKVILAWRKNDKEGSEIARTLSERVVEKITGSGR